MDVNTCDTHYHKINTQFFFSYFLSSLKKLENVNRMLSFF